MVGTTAVKKQDEEFEEEEEESEDEDVDGGDAEDDGIIASPLRLIARTPENGHGDVDLVPRNDEGESSTTQPTRREPPSGIGSDPLVIFAGFSVAGGQHLLHKSLEYLPIVTRGSVGRIPIHFVIAHRLQEALNVGATASRPLAYAGEDGLREEDEEQVLYLVRLVQTQCVILH